MGDDSLESVYVRFSEIFGNGAPIRRRTELGAAIRAAGLSADTVTEEWLRSLRRTWIYGESNDPFEDVVKNRTYRRELMS